MVPPKACTPSKHGRRRSMCLRRVERPNVLLGFERGRRDAPGLDCQLHRLRQLDRTVQFETCCEQVAVSRARVPQHCKGRRVCGAATALLSSGCRSSRLARALLLLHLYSPLLCNTSVFVSSVRARARVSSLPLQRWSSPDATRPHLERRPLVLLSEFSHLSKLPKVKRRDARCTPIKY